MMNALPGASIMKNADPQLVKNPYFLQQGLIQKCGGVKRKMASEPVCP
jgi:hypothetical protein